MSLDISELKTGEVSILKVAGFIDTSTSSTLEEIIKNYFDSSRVKIVVDLSGVEFVSSAGWGVFVAYLRKMRSKGGDIKLAAMIEKVDQVFKLMEFDSLIDAYPTVEEAAKGF